MKIKNENKYENKNKNKIAGVKEEPIPATHEWLFQSTSRRGGKPRRGRGRDGPRCGGPPTHSRLNIVIILATRRCSSLQSWGLLWETGEKVMSGNGYMSRKPCKVLDLSV